MKNDELENLRNQKTYVLEVDRNSTDFRMIHATITHSHNTRKGRIGHFNYGPPNYVKNPDFTLLD